MIRFRVKELIAEKAFRDGVSVTMTEVAAATQINRGVLSKMANERGCNTVTDNLDGLCRYFKCQLSDLAEYVPDEQVTNSDTQREKKLTTASDKRLKPAKKRNFK